MTVRSCVRKALFAVACASALLVTGAAAAKDVVIHAGTLFDGVSKQTRNKVSIIIKDDRIVAVQPGFVTPAGAQVIDLSDKTVLPGLIDSHVHVSSTVGPRINPFQARFTRTDLDEVLGMTWNARKLLEAGFTTVRNVGASNGVDLALKKAINAGIVVGPRMWVSLEPLGPTGGHGDPGNGLDPAVSSSRWQHGVVNTPEEVRFEVRDHKKRGADLIKIMPSGGVLSINDDPRHTLMTPDEVKAAVDTAHALGMKVAAHAAGADAINLALRMGVDTIEHASLADQDSYKLFKQHDAFLVPTLLVAAQTREAVLNNPGSLNPSVAEKNKMIWAAKMKMMADANALGVKFAFGTDTGEGQNAKEFALMVQAGVKPIDALLSATSVAADLIGAPQDIGSIQPGRYADVIAVTGDPLKDVTVLERVGFVMKGGEVVKGVGKP